jgi:hypothetical protein
MIQAPTPQSAPSLPRAWGGWIGHCVKAKRCQTGENRERDPDVVPANPHLPLPGQCRGSVGRER